MAMRTDFISDMHTGPGDGSDDFHQDAALIRLLKTWYWLGDTVICAGDGPELLQARWSDIYRAHRLLWCVIFDVVSIYVVGNHDWQWLDNPPCSSGPQFVPYYQDDGLLVMHGDEGDELVQRWPGACRLVSRMVGWLERRVHPDSDIWADLAFRRLAGIGRYGRSKRYAEAVVADLIPGHGIHTVVMGHTHERWRGVVEGVRVYNTGTWIGNKQGWVTLET